MGLDLWFREDIARILASTQSTMQAAQDATSPNDELTAAYRRGFDDAIQSLAIAFGVARAEQKPSLLVIRDDEASEW